jgi:hypothetical protein
MIRSALAPSDGDPDREFLESFDCISPEVIDAVLADPANWSLPAGGPARQRWLLYSALQAAVAAQRYSRPERALEERLDKFLTAFLDGELPDDLREARKWLRNLPSNRAKKHAHQDRLLEEFARGAGRRQAVSSAAAAEVSDDLRLVRRHVSDLEWILLNRATVEELATVALSLGLALGTLKSMLSRCRARVRRRFE